MRVLKILFWYWTMYLFMLFSLVLFANIMYHAFN